MPPDAPKNSLLSPLARFTLGWLIGDALALPINGKPHHVVRMYFKGITGYTDDIVTTMQKTGFPPGASSKDPVPIIKTLFTKETPPTLTSWMTSWAVSFGGLRDREALALSTILNDTFLSPSHRMTEIMMRVDAALLSPEHLARINDAATCFPNDAAQRCNDVATPEDALHFALAMLQRSQGDIESTLLSTINMGGAACLSGGIVGGALGLWKGVEHFPKEWKEGLLCVKDVLSVVEGWR